MTETLSGREPLQIVEFVQPLCANVWSKGRCRAGGGRVSEEFSTGWETLTLEGWTGTNANLSILGAGGVLYSATSTDPRMISATSGAGFSGDDFRYLLVRGRLNSSVNLMQAFYQSTAGGFAASRAMTAVNNSEIVALGAGDEFVAVFDASDSPNYATDWVGDTINRLRFDFGTGTPTVIEVYSVEVTSESPLNNVGLECYNTRGSCDYPNGYSQSPEEPLTADVSAVDREILVSSDLQIDADTFFAVDVRFPLSAANGVIWKQGASVRGSYLGVTSGNIVMRAGNSSIAGPASTMGYVSTPVAPYLGKSITIVGEFNVADDKVSFWIWDKQDKNLTFIGSNEASAGFPSGEWASSDDGSVGYSEGNTAIGEDAGEFNGEIDELRVYNNVRAPNMDNPYKLSLLFSKGELASRDVPGSPYILPLLKSVSTAPARVNLSGSDTNSGGLGNRASVSMSFEDGPHTDRLVDPYLGTRLHQPLERATFWTKWLTRNPYRYNYLTRVYEGYAGQTLDEMTRREYVLTNTRGPTYGGVTFTSKDPLTLVEDRKAEAPKASNGELQEDLGAATTVFTVVNASATEYDPSGTIRINDELMVYTSVVQTDTNIVFNISERGSDNTEASEHSSGDVVQACVRYSGARLDDVVRNLCVKYSSMPFGLLDLTGSFVEETDDFLSTYKLTTVISEPTTVTKLLSELQEQCGFSLFWDERISLIKMRASRGITEDPVRLTAESNILAGTFSIADKPNRRISRVNFYYDHRNPVLPFSPANFRAAKSNVDLPSETESQYGTAQIRNFFSRWINTGAEALNTASKLISRYSDVPREATFEMDAKDRSVWVGDVVEIEHFLDVDVDGNNNVSRWTITSAEETTPGERVRYTAEDTTLYGVVSRIQSDSAPDYTPGADKFLFWIGDNDGLLSDGSPCSRIA